MNLARVAQILGMTESRLQGLQETIIRESAWPEPRLIRFEKEASGVEAGTVVFENGDIVFGYPKIRRPLFLAPALERHFPRAVAVEEKMNGHNVRILSVSGETVALTRGGFICPYASEVARRLIEEEIFEKNPSLVLCGEMVGPENPYVAKEVYPTDSIDFYLFDVAEKNRKGTAGVHKTHELAEQFGLKATAFLGQFQKDVAAEKIRQIVLRLGRQGRKGGVSEPRGEVVQLGEVGQTGCVVGNLEDIGRGLGDRHRTGARGGVGCSGGVNGTSRRRFDLTCKIAPSGTATSSARATAAGPAPTRPRFQDATSAVAGSRSVPASRSPRCPARCPTRARRRGRASRAGST